MKTVLHPRAGLRSCITGLAINDINRHPANDMDDLKPFAALRISGADRISFLQGQLTNDLRLLQADRPLLAGWCNPQGRLLCTAWVIDWQESVWLLLPAELADTVAKRLKMFVLRAAVQIEIASLAPQLLVSTPPDADMNSANSLLSICFYDDQSCALQVCPGAAIRLQITPAPGIASDAALHGSWQLQVIRAGIPIICSSTSGEFVPQMVNLDLLGGIGFTKGCYVGQEIVARTHNLGRIKRRMFAYSVKTTRPVKPGDAIYADGDTAGQVVNCARSDDTVELLAVIKLDCLGLPLRLQADGQEVLNPLPLPYPVPEVADR